MFKRDTKSDFAKLAFSQGIENIVIALNKLNHEENNDSAERILDKIKEILKIFKKIGFKIENIKVLPISILENINILEKSDQFIWYKGNSLIEEL